MFRRWRLEAARHAMRRGQLDEAGRLLAQDGGADRREGRQLTHQLACLRADRARQTYFAGDSSAGWKELSRAGALAGDAPEVLETRRQLLDATIGKAEGDLARGDSSQALRRLRPLRRRRRQSDRLQRVWKLARRMETARALELRGRFAEAQAQWNAVLAQRPDLSEVRRRRAEGQRLSQRAAELEQGLYGATQKGDWGLVAALAEQLLRVAPANRMARRLRKEAWRQAGAEWRDAPSFAETAPGRPATKRAGGSAVMAQRREPDREAGQRFLLWIDAVGGFLVCMGDAVTLGQAVPGARVDVPILGDLSRRQAVLRRVGESYVLDPLQPVEVGGRTVEEATVVGDGTQLDLGSGAQLRLRVPHPLSATARLEFQRRGRLQSAADGVLLMAESCVLGPGPDSHVVCRDWTREVVLFRRDEALFCRSAAPLTLDGAEVRGAVKLHPGCRVEGEEFSFGLEPA